MVIWLIPLPPQMSMWFMYDPTEHLEEPPSYKGFNNFDEISVTEATEEDEDSGLSSLASLGNFRKPIQAFDFSDLGFGRPQRFSLSNLRKK